MWGFSIFVILQLYSFLPCSSTITFTNFLHHLSGFIMWNPESESTNYNGVVTLNHGLHTHRFEQRGQSWYVTTDIPSDFLVQIGDFSFHLHKSALLSKSGKMNRIIQESNSEEVILDDLPGGVESFELAAKFCYGIAIDLTSTVISGLRCAAEYLEMTEEFEEGNLIFKTQAFINHVMISSWKDSILVLKSCEKLSPWAENLQIVRRCSESIALKASANGIRWTHNGKQDSSPNRNRNWWCEDISILNIDHFVRVITAIKVKGTRSDLVGSAIMHYATKWLPGMTKEGSTGSVEDRTGATAASGDMHCGLHMIIAVNKGDHSSSPQGKRQRMIIESLISIIPLQNDSVSCSFLLRLLRLATIVDVAPALITELEKRVGMQLEQATLADLLIPSYNRSETMYDVDLFQRVLEHFLIQEKMDKNEGIQGGNESNATMKVARLVDCYLNEVSKDKNLSLTKFQVLAEALPESARSCDDGVYRAIDSYLKAHPMLEAHDRRRLCRVMDIQKLTMDACAHAAQNERLPLRVVVQVIFSEQIKISNTLSNTAFKVSDEPNYQPIIPNRKTLLEETPQSFQDGWATAKKDISTLKFDLESVKTKYLELRHDMESMQRQYDKVTKLKQQSAWSSGWKKLSKITKITTIEDTGIGSQGNTEHTVKTPRRWRNSLS